MKRLCLALFLLSSLSPLAQDSYDSVSTETAGRKGFIILPVIFSSPETSIGFGAASMYYFRTDTGKHTRPSNLQSIFIYTLENQLLAQLPFDLFLNQNEYWISGELSYFIYPYQYYGMGSSIDLDTYDPYDASFLRAFADVFKKIGDKTYLGPRFRFDHYYSVTSDSPNNLLVPSTTGFSPGTVSGIGLGLVYDNRDNIFSPAHGSFLDVNLVHYGSFAGSDYTFTNFSLDARKYADVGKKRELGLQFIHQSVLGQGIPFYNLALLGGGRMMRGYYRGAYRDQNFTAFQSEFRTYLFKNILAAAFTSVGAVGEKISKYNRLFPAAGIGLRYELNKKEHIRIRADFAVGRKTTGFYLNINESF